MTKIPEPKNWGTFRIEPFSDYISRWPKDLAHIPDSVIETWIHRHWPQFQQWAPLRPIEWTYEFRCMKAEEILAISHVNQWMKTLAYWGEDLCEGRNRKSTWLGNYMLEVGTTPSPMIVALNAGGWTHPRERGNPNLHEPYQLIEGHMRLAYLQAMIRRSHFALQHCHDVILVTLPSNCRPSRLQQFGGGIGMTGFAMLTPVSTLRFRRPLNHRWQVSLNSLGGTIIVGGGGGEPAFPRPVAA